MAKRVNRECNGRRSGTPKFATGKTGAASPCRVIVRAGVELEQPEILAESQPKPAKNVEQSYSKARASVEAFLGSRGMKTASLKADRDLRRAAAEVFAVDPSLNMQEMAAAIRALPKFERKARYERAQAGHDLPTPFVRPRVAKRPKSSKIGGGKECAGEQESESASIRHYREHMAMKAQREAAAAADGG